MALVEQFHRRPKAFLTPDCSTVSIGMAHGARGTISPKAKGFLTVARGNPRVIRRFRLTWRMALVEQYHRRPKAFLTVARGTPPGHSTVSIAMARGARGTISPKAKDLHRVG
ncbi:MAG: hypothetical protein KDB14_24475, partial [Planctomycetales bacterium]|nr:hypothetical protein [Planctomycetales bacterium]